MFKTSRWDWYIALTVVLFYLIWLGLRVLRLGCITYTVTSHNIAVNQGILFHKTDNIELFRVKDVNMKRSIFQRVLGTGNICIESSDSSMPSVVLRNIPEPRQVFEKIRSISVDANLERGVLQVEP